MCMYQSAIVSRIAMDAKGSPGNSGLVPRSLLPDRQCRGEYSNLEEMLLEGGCIRENEAQVALR